MPKNLVICFDGTNNEFGRVNTNVVRLYQCLDLSNRAKQVGYYSPGLGTISEPGMISKIGKKWSRILGKGFGRGIVQDIEEAYCFLMERYEKDDRIYIFGFSRGAYTARALAGLLRQLGVLDAGASNLVPYTTKLFQALEENAMSDDPSSYWKVCNAFKSTFARTRKQCPVHFLGLWDTVSSVGWLWNPKSFPFVTNNPSVRIVRHALAIDERRWLFRHTHWWSKDKPAKNQMAQEVWFPGVHSDIGGGYPTQESALWRAPFVWILTSAKNAGMILDTKRLQAILRSARPFASNYVSPMHNSLSGGWHLAEIFPKIRWSAKARRKYPAIGFWRRREIPVGALIHCSALHRIQTSKYKPKNLSARFIDSVKKLDPKSMPPFLAYTP
jgi:uncharacterized protein (DUF2235 family)